jgi:hypothetical protein
LQEAAFSRAVGRDLGGDVAFPFPGGPDVGKQKPEDLVRATAAGKELYRRDTETFLKNLSAQGHGSGGHTADVGVVGPVGHVEQQAAGRTGFRKNGAHERHVRQVCAALVRIVEDHCVARFHFHGAHGRPNRHGHRTQVNGHMIPLRHELAGSVEHGARVVPPFFDVGREGGTPQRDAHLFGHGGVKGFEDLHSDWVEAGLEWQTVSPQKH